MPNPGATQILGRLSLLFALILVNAFFAMSEIAVISLNETKLERLAADYRVTPTGIATAWLTRHPAHMQVVTGTTRPSRLHEIAQGADVVLTRQEWYELFAAAGHFVP